jgi:gluconolactonase
MPKRQVMKMIARFCSVSHKAEIRKFLSATMQGKLFLCLLFTSLSQVCAQEAEQPKGSIEVISSELSKIINPQAKVEVLAEGFQFTEGPLWIEKEQMLLVSDIPANTIYKWTKSGKEVYLKPGGYTDTTKRGGFMGPNGLLLSTDGKLWICQHGDRRIAEMNSTLNAPAARFTTVAGSYNGKRLNSPNDLVLSKNGDLYFTDPSYGFERGASDPKKELPYQGVYRMDKKGIVTLLLDSISQPNGIAISPDGKTLFVSNSDQRKRRWYSYSFGKDGKLTDGKIFYDAGQDQGAGVCDGFKIDKRGNLFGAGPGGVWIFNQAGKLIGRIKLTGVTASNCALTPDGKTLYITAVQYLLRVKMR